MVSKTFKLKVSQRHIQNRNQPASAYYIKKIQFKECLQMIVYYAWYEESTSLKRLVMKEIIM